MDGRSTRRGTSYETDTDGELYRRGGGGGGGVALERFGVRSGEKREGSVRAAGGKKVGSKSVEARRHGAPRPRRAAPRQAARRSNARRAARKRPRRDNLDSFRRIVLRISAHGAETCPIERVREPER